MHTLRVLVPDLDDVESEEDDLGIVDEHEERAAIDALGALWDRLGGRWMTKNGDAILAELTIDEIPSAWLEADGEQSWYWNFDAMGTFPHAEHGSVVDELRRDGSLPKAFTKHGSVFCVANLVTHPDVDMESAAAIALTSALRWFSRGPRHICLLGPDFLANVALPKDAVAVTPAIYKRIAVAAGFDVMRLGKSMMYWASIGRWRASWPYRAKPVMRRKSASA